ncbi:MAG: hypothetical protein NXI27_07040 [Alphaproteobacteria bacterium]|nr:hypothetical protein [Alphaproteobacteria bacterium]
MVKSRLETGSGGATVDVAVTADEMEVLTIFRTHWKGKSGGLNEDLFRADLVEFGNDTSTKPEYIPISKEEDYVTIIGTLDEFSAEVVQKVNKEKNKKGLLQAFSELLDRAEATHLRVRETISRYDETSKLSDASSRRTKELLAYRHNQK